MISSHRIFLQTLKRCEGSTLIEFSLSVFLLVIVLLSIVEMGRMVLVYNTVANSARTGCRYAITHGSDRTGTGADGPSSSGSTTEIETVVKNFASAGLLDTSRLAITVSYPDSGSSNTPGSHVSVQVIYPYDPFTTFLPLRVNLGSTSEGVITF